MRKKTKWENCRIWKLLGSIGLFLVICALCQYAFSLWPAGGDEEDSQRMPLMIMVEGSAEAFEINLAAKSTSEMSFEQFLGEKLQISGRKDAKHGYFEGKVVWNGQKICIVNLVNDVSVELRQDIRSFMIGDYYVSTRYNAEKEEMELLVFYCP